MIQTKLIVTGDPATFQREVNNFLKDLLRSNFISIQYEASPGLYSVLITYLKDAYYE